MNCTSYPVPHPKTLHQCGLKPSNILTQGQSQKHVAILASDDFEGRGTLEPV